MKKMIGFLHYLSRTLQSQLQKNKQQKFIENLLQQSEHQYKKQSIIKNRNNKHKIISKTQLRVHSKLKLQKKRKKQKICQQDEVNFIDQKDEKDKILNININKNFNKYLLQENNQDLFCSICKNSFLSPAVTDCSHTFCLQCIENSLKYSIKCPLCRTEITDSEHYGLSLCQTIQKYSTKVYQHKNKDKHIQRMNDHIEWKKNRFIDEKDLKEKEMIDLWDLRRNKWKRVQIMKIFDDQQPKSIMIQYVHQDKQKQIIQLPSLRIAKHKFHSQQPRRIYSNIFQSPQLHRLHFQNIFLTSSQRLRNGLSTSNLFANYVRRRQQRVRQIQRERERQQMRQQMLERVQIRRPWLLQRYDDQQIINNRSLQDHLSQRQRERRLQIMRQRFQYFIQRQTVADQNSQTLQLRNSLQQNFNIFTSRRQQLPRQQVQVNIQHLNQAQPTISINLQDLLRPNIQQQQINIQIQQIQQNLPNLNPNINNNNHDTNIIDVDQENNIEVGQQYLQDDNQSFQQL